MIYLNEKNLKDIGFNWNETIDAIEYAVRCLNKGEYAQPIKPYLKYGNQKNRIIAMPAFVGGDISVAGIKWIASFPDNIKNGIPRAHSVVILNNANTGEPIAVINTALLSIIRTVSVSGLITKYFNSRHNLAKFNLGIIGWGPIGQHHLKMFIDLYGDEISKILIYDIRPVIDINNIEPDIKDKIIVADCWEDVYLESDVFITCTVSNSPYINMKPRNGALILNISLRDFKIDSFDYFKNSIIVDDWEEVCRENTDIENMFKYKGLTKESTKSIVDVVCNNCLDCYSDNNPIMFNPMGMAIFDMAIGEYYYKKAIEKGYYQMLE